MVWEEFKAVRYEYTDGAKITVQWLPLVSGEWPYGDEKIHVVKKDFSYYGK